MEDWLRRPVFESSLCSRVCASRLLKRQNRRHAGHDGR